MFAPSQLNRNFIVHQPSEVKLQIFSYLSPQELCRTSSVSKEFNVLADDNTLWRPHVKIRALDSNSEKNIFRHQFKYLLNILKDNKNHSKLKEIITKDARILEFIFDTPVLLDRLKKFPFLYAILGDASQANEDAALFVLNNKELCGLILNRLNGGLSLLDMAKSHLKIAIIVFEKDELYQKTLNSALSLNTGDSARAAQYMTNSLKKISQKHLNTEEHTNRENLLQALKQKYSETKVIASLHAVA